MKVIWGEMAVTAEHESFFEVKQTWRGSNKSKEDKRWYLLVGPFYHAPFEEWLLEEMWKQTTIWLAVHFSPTEWAHINKLHHELAACWDNEMHLCPIILSIICFCPGSYC